MSTKEIMLLPHNMTHQSHINTVELKTRTTQRLIHRWDMEAMICNNSSTTNNFIRGNSNFFC